MTAYHFNQFSAVGLIANSVVVPIMAIGGVICGLSACAIGMIAPALGAPLLVAAGWSLAAGTYLAGWFARWPAAYFRIFTPTPLEIAIAYGFLLLWLTRPIERAAITVLPESAAAPLARWRLTCCAILAVMLAADAGWWAHDRWFTPSLRVTFLSVGEGDAAVVRFAGGRVMLIDAGGAWPGGFDFGERIVARYLWAEKIMRVDYLVVSHPDLDHFGGMAFVARNFSPGEFWVTGAVKHEPMYMALLAEVAAAKIPLRVVDSAMRPLVLGGATVRCLGPAPEEAERRDNDLSMVLRIAQGLQNKFPQSVLFTGDIEAAGERALLARTPAAMLAATVLKVPHHGSRTSSSGAFVAAVRPQVAVLSLGYRNPFGFPAPEVVERYIAVGVRFQDRPQRRGGAWISGKVRPNLPSRCARTTPRRISSAILFFRGRSDVLERQAFAVEESRLAVFPHRLLDLAHQLSRRFFQIQHLPVRLLRQESRVPISLAAVAFGVVDVNADGVTVG